MSQMFQLAAFLLQEHDGIKHPVMYASRKLLPREQNYTVGEREALAIVWVVEKFHRCLYGQHFILESNHRPLEYIQSSNSENTMGHIGDEFYQAHCCTLAFIALSVLFVFCLLVCRKHMLPEQRATSIVLHADVCRECERSMPGDANDNH